MRKQRPKAYCACVLLLCAWALCVVCTSFDIHADARVFRTWTRADAAPVLPVPARLGTGKRLAQDWIWHARISNARVDDPADHPIRLSFFFLLCNLYLCFGALRAFYARVPALARPRSLLCIIGHPHQAPPVFA